MMMRFLIFLLFPAIFISCVSIDNSNNDRIVAENTVLKRKNSHIERENSVIRRENTDLAGTIKEKDATLEKRAEDITAFKKKYDTDTLLLNNKFNNLKTSSELQKKQSEERIRLLSEQNTVLEKELAVKVKALTEEIRKNTEKFNTEREKAKKDYAKLEADLSKKIEELNSVIGIKDKEIAELKESIDKINSKTKETTEPSSLKNPGVKKKEQSEISSISPNGKEKQ